MDKIYDHKKVEERIYEMWEQGGYFKPEVNPDGEPYCIILPPPNANAPLHLGHAMMSIEDILIRYHRMRGKAALFLPGADHAGFETQYVFEKLLQKEGKSRFDYDRKVLYQMIWDHVQKSRGVMEGQLRKLGFSLDWTRRKFTVDPDIITLVYKTFKKMYDEGLIYRGERLVNYCTKDGTSFSDLEVKYVEQKDPLYYITYGPFVLATVRPETKFGDTAVAVNPHDKRYNHWVGEEIEVEGLLGKFKIKVIGDEAIDPAFGTGVMKVTPAHDFNDFEIGKRHNLEMKIVIGFDGKLTELTGPYAGLRVKAARQKVVEDMHRKGLIDHIDEEYTHSVATCYKCGTVLEPLSLPQWYVKVKPLAQKAIEVVKKGDIKIHPDRFDKIYYQWLGSLRDWNISRQVVWGIAIPAWQCMKCDEWIVTDGDTPSSCPSCSGTQFQQDPDTFDTWFSSSQWPFITLQTTPGAYEKFYPTSVMETGYDILKAWVSRMVMMGVYVTGSIPFVDVVLHGLVNDPYGKKMSKSKGNVVNPMDLIEQYGADALRFALVYGTSLGNDQALSYPKMEAARKFTNKLWNMGRFIEMKRTQSAKRKVQNFEELLLLAKHETDKEWVGKVQELSNGITKYIDNYQFNLAAERLYEFIWHEFADKYIEDVKNRIDEDSFIILNSLFLHLLQLLHPFMPFVTEEMYQLLTKSDKPLIVESWPR